MIKSEDFTVCATICKAAEVKQSGDGTPFITFNVKVPVQGRDESGFMTISISADGDKNSVAYYTLDRRVTVKGALSFRKKEQNTYYNLRAESIAIENSNVPDKLEGSLSFKGKVSKHGVQSKKDSKQNDYQTFSAYSSDRNGDQREFIWVHFLNFKPCLEAFLAANAFVEVKGDLQLGFYKGKVTHECIVREVSEWVLEKK